MMSVASRVERLERDPRMPRPCWLCEWIDTGTRAFNDYLKARGVDTEACEVVESFRACPMCGIERSANVAHWTPEDFELERRYYHTIASHDQRAIRAAKDEFDARLAEIGVAVIGKHYARATAACNEAMKSWWEAHRLEVSDEDLIAVTRNPAEHRMVR